MGAAPRTRVLDVAETSSGDGEIELWSAEHDGYTALDPPATHRRTIRLDRVDRRFDIVDEIDTEGLHPLRMAFHFGPSVDAALRRDHRRRAGDRTAVARCVRARSGDVAAARRPRLGDSPRRIRSDPRLVLTELRGEGPDGHGRRRRHDLRADPATRERARVP